MGILSEEVGRAQTVVVSRETGVLMPELSFQTHCSLGVKSLGLEVGRERD